ncbi:hypothetical protein C8J57DRAFT_1261760 [Mycena rebaudengoi]|nr:hypothetical protein C8J57DRAFT_1261760 [Mycena rebaudengoi]
MQLNENPQRRKARRYIESDSSIQQRGAIYDENRREISVARDRYYKAKPERGADRRMLGAPAAPFLGPQVGRLAAKRAVKLVCRYCSCKVSRRESSRVPSPFFWLEIRRLDKRAVSARRQVVKNNASQDALGDGKERGRGF